MKAKDKEFIATAGSGLAALAIVLALFERCGVQLSGPSMLLISVAVPFGFGTICNFLVWSRCFPRESGHR